MSKNKYVRGFFVGSLMGIAAGVLILPQVDSQTKKKLMNRGASMMETASHIVPWMGKR